MLIMKTKKDIATYISTSPPVLESKKAYEEDESEGFEEVTTELAKLLICGEGSPDFGEDWEEWLEDNIEEMLGEAISIVM